jgi:hypothetical protein
MSFKPVVARAQESFKEKARAKESAKRAGIVMNLVVGAQMSARRQR